MSSAKEDGASVDGGGGGGRGVCCPANYIVAYAVSVKLRLHSTIYSLFPRVTVTETSPRRGRQHSFVEIDHEIFSTVILSLPLIQEGQLSVSGERMCTILVNRLED